MHVEKLAVTERRTQPCAVFWHSLSTNVKMVESHNGMHRYKEGLTNVCYYSQGRNEGGKGGTIPRVPNHYGGAE